MNNRMFAIVMAKILEIIGLFILTQVILILIILSPFFSKYFGRFYQKRDMKYQRLAKEHTKQMQISRDAEEIKDAEVGPEAID